MKKFLIESAIFLALILSSFYLVFLQADGNTDSHYNRLTKPRQTSLILGTSKAAQGIIPEVVNEQIKRNDLFNFSFSIDHSPWGPTYLATIKQKLRPDAKNGVFILQVDAWSISSTAENPNDSSQFEELDLFLAKIRHVNLHPNIPYLLKFYDEPYYKLLFNSESNKFLHNDGWLEISVSMDSTAFNNRLEKRVAFKKEKLTSYKFSQIRLDYLIKTIKYLQEHGEVYMVRLPVHARLMELDEHLLPDFNEIISGVSETTHSPYLDLSYLNNQMLYTDGNHMTKESAKKVSEIIGTWILGF